MAKVRSATAEVEEHDDVFLTPDGKNAAAVALGRMGGLKGGQARAIALSSEQRSSIARSAAKARWASKKGEP